MNDSDAYGILVELRLYPDEIELLKSTLMDAYSSTVYLVSEKASISRILNELCLFAD